MIQHCVVKGWQLQRGLRLLLFLNGTMVSFTPIESQISERFFRPGIRFFVLIRKGYSVRELKLLLLRRDHAFCMFLYCRCTAKSGRETSWFNFSWRTRSQEYECLFVVGTYVKCISIQLQKNSPKFDEIERVGIKAMKFRCSPPF